MHQSQLFTVVHRLSINSIATVCNSQLFTIVLSVQLVLFSTSGGMKGLVTVPFQNYTQRHRTHLTHEGGAFATKPALPAPLCGFICARYPLQNADFALRDHFLRELHRTQPSTAPEKPGVSFAAVAVCHTAPCEARNGLSQQCLQSDAAL